MQHQQLVLFTSDFPFGRGETFLETEIDYLAKGFGEILIISNNTKDQQARNLPSNCMVERLDLSVPKKWKALSQIFDPLFWAERKIIKSVYSLKLSKGIFSTMLVSLYRAKKVDQKVQEILRTDKNNQSVFYSYWCDDSALGLALAAKRNPALKTFSRVHGWDLFFDRSPLGYLPYRHFISQQLTQVFSISNMGLRYAKGIWKVDIDRNFGLARLGVNNNRPLKSIDRDFQIIVSCSGLIPLKRVHLIVESLNLIKDKKIHWVHFGDGPERTRISELCKNLPSNISFELKSNVNNQSIYDYYDENRPNLFVNVSTSEGIPVSIMEAMSFGIPTIATDVGGAGEIVDDTSGKLISCNPDSNEIANAIVSFLDLDPHDFQKRREGAFNKYNSEFNAKENYNSFVNQMLESFR